MYPVTERNTLVEALTSMSRLARRASAKEFLEGLSTDELQYIAAYFGARTLDPAMGDRFATRGRRACEIQRYERGKKAEKLPYFSTNHRSRTGTKRAGAVSHKMIVLLEFLTVSERTASAADSWPAAGGCA